MKPRRPTIALGGPDSEPTDAGAGETPTEARAGEVLHAYRLGRALGAGAWGAVYRAQHLHLPREAAIKILRRRWFATESAHQRMLREAVVLLELSHPNVVSLIDFGLNAEGLPFLVTELLQGVTLHEYLHRKQRLSVEETALIGAQIARGLAAIHDKQVVHRDLKPANIMLVRGDPARVKILDLGLSKDTGHDSPLTRPNEAVGTPLYMAPEQIHREVEVTEAADRYALGAILYEALSGRDLYEGSAIEVMRAQVSAPIPPLPPSPLSPLVRGLLAKDPRQRFGPASAIVKELEKVLEPPKKVEIRWISWTALFVAFVALLVAVFK